MPRRMGMLIISLWRAVFDYRSLLFCVPSDDSRWRRYARCPQNKSGMWTLVIYRFTRHRWLQCLDMIVCWDVSGREHSQILSSFLLPASPRRCFTVRNRLRDSKLWPCLLMQHFAKRGAVEIFHNFQRSYSTVFPRGQTCPVYVTRALKWCLHEAVFPPACNFHTKS